MKPEPRNFNGNYPLAGEKIGPAWRKAWDMLSTDHWCAGPDIAHVVAGEVGLDPRTVKNLLYQAHRAGQLESIMKVPVGRTQKAAHYRISS